MPAYNEERNDRRVIDELRAFDPGLDVVVVSDGSTDRTAEVAARARRARRPAAVQPRHRRRRADRLPLRAGRTATSSPSASTATASTIPPSSAKVLAPVLARRGRHRRRLALHRRRRLPLVGDAPRSASACSRWVVSAIARQRVTDTTSGFQALNRRAIALFAADYPHDYPEVEAMVMAIRHRLRLREVPVTMREREHGPLVDHARSRSVYYMVKVLLALFVGLFRRRRRARWRTLIDAATPLKVSIAATVGVAPPRARRLRADPLAPAARALRAALAR